MPDHPDPSPDNTPVPELVHLKQRLNIKSNDANMDAQLDWLLRVATAWVDDRVYRDPDQVPGYRHPEVVEAILILASRLYARRSTPEGVAGWPEIGLTRISREDPDLSSLLERHEDYGRVGIG